MSCVVWRNELKKWLKRHVVSENGEPVIPEELRIHAESCSQCARLLQAAVLLMKPIRGYNLVHRVGSLV